VIKVAQFRLVEPEVSKIKYFCSKKKFSMLDRTLTTQANSLGILRVSILINPPTSTATLEKCSYVYSITVELYFSIWVCGSLKESQIWSKYFMSIVYYCRNNVFYSLIKSQFLDIKWFMILLISHLLSLYLFIWKLPVVKKRKWIVLYTRMPQSFRFADFWDLWVDFWNGLWGNYREC